MNKYINPSRLVWKELVARPTLELEDLSQFIKEVFKQVKLN